MLYAAPKTWDLVLKGPIYSQIEILPCNKHKVL